MERNQVLGMVCGYYLSRFDADAYDGLGFETRGAAHDAIGRALGVPADSVRNWRDEFDPVHDNPRKGWHRRDMRPSRAKALDVLGRYSQSEIEAFVGGILASPSGPEAERVVDLLGLSDADGQPAD
jgi:5-methylcytosine-specific restriction protein A